MLSIVNRLGRLILRPNPLVWAAAVARQLTPVLSWKDTHLLFRHRDVVAALTGTDYGVQQIYAPAMKATTGDFFLGMDDGERYRSERKFAESGIYRTDIRRIMELSDGFAARIMADRAEAGEVDLVTDYFRRVPVMLLRAFFGVPGPGLAVEAEETLARWMRAIFWDIFLNFGGDAAVTARAEGCARALRSHLSERVRADKKSIEAGKATSDTFLGRLVANAAPGRPFEYMDDDAIVRNVGGVVVGAVDTISQACSLALSELMLRPRELERATQAARAGRDETLRGFFLEALRFNQHTPILIRHATRDAVLAAGTDQKRNVRRNARVIPVLVAASFDPEVVRTPTAFDPSRDPDQNMNFGWGIHRCFGQRLVHAVAPVLLRHVLLLDALQNVRSRFDPYTSEGPFPDHYPVRFSEPSR